MALAQRNACLFLEIHYHASHTFVIQVSRLRDTGLVMSDAWYVSTYLTLPIWIAMSL